MPENIGWLEILVAAVAAGIAVGLLVVFIVWAITRMINYKLWHRPRNRR